MQLSIVHNPLTHALEYLYQSALEKHPELHLIICITDGCPHEGSCLRVAHLQVEALPQVFYWATTTIAGQATLGHQCNRCYDPLCNSPGLQDTINQFEALKSLCYLPQCSARAQTARCAPDPTKVRCNKCALG